MAQHKRPIRRAHRVRKLEASDHVGAQTAHELKTKHEHYALCTE